MSKKFEELTGVQKLVVNATVLVIFILFLVIVGTVVVKLLQWAF